MGTHTDTEIQIIPDGQRDRQTDTETQGRADTGIDTHIHILHRQGGRRERECVHGRDREEKQRKTSRIHALLSESLLNAVAL